MFLTQTNLTLLKSKDFVPICCSLCLPLLDRVPERGGPHPVVDESEEGFLDEELCVEDHELGGGGNEVIAAVELEELHKYLVFVLLWEKV